jgi:hypothetical protein
MTQVKRVLTALALALAVATPALAGPPLLCHPFDIGTATSLPWDGTAGWSQGRADYSIKQLVADTEAILQPGTPVIVRMETLRRAAIYASRDTAVASALINTLTTKARAAQPAADGLAALDAAYFIEALHQVTMLGESGEFRGRVAGVKRVVGEQDAAPFLAQAVQARSSDPAVAFAAALITMSTDKQAYGAYATRARAGAAQDALLARNINHLL